MGAGFFSQRMLETYVNSSIVAIDGAAAMLELAKARLSELSKRVEWIRADFRDLPSAVLSPDRFDVVITSYALHHLNGDEKLGVLEQVVKSLKPSGWFLNADIVKAESKGVEQRIQELRVKGVTSRAPKLDDRFGSAERTRTFLDELEATEQDQPQTLDADIKIARKAGISNAEVYWKEYREVVFGGPIGTKRNRT